MEEPGISSCENGRRPQDGTRGYKAFADDLRGEAKEDAIKRESLESGTCRISPSLVNVRDRGRVPQAPDGGASIRIGLGSGRFVVRVRPRWPGSNRHP